MSQSSASLQEAVEIVKARSREDRAFRALALRNSQAALDESGYHSTETAVVFTERAGTVRADRRVMVVELPPAECDVSDELSEADLEEVSGGGDGSGSGTTWNP